MNGGVNDTVEYKSEYAGQRVALYDECKHEYLLTVYVLVIGSAAMNIVR